MADCQELVLILAPQGKDESRFLFSGTKTLSSWGRVFVILASTNMSELLAHSSKYPYLVIKAMPGVYEIQYPTKPLADKEKMIQWAKEMTAKHSRYTCAVFSPDECVYVELDGKIKLRTSIPAGGIILAQ